MRMLGGRSLEEIAAEREARYIDCPCDLGRHVPFPTPYCARCNKHHGEPYAHRGEKICGSCKQAKKLAEFRKPELRGCVGYESSACHACRAEMVTTTGDPFEGLSA